MKDFLEIAEKILYELGIKLPNETNDIRKSIINDQIRLVKQQINIYKTQQ